MKNYIKIKTEGKISNFPTNIPALRKMNDEEWKECIFSYVLSYYKEVDSKEIQKLIEKESLKPFSEVETVIKKHLRKWFRLNEKFYNEAFLVNVEVGSEGEKEGYYDIKFEHGYWNFTKTYFSFECKNLGKTKSIKRKKSVQEYVYTKKKIKGQMKEDGGIYRHFINKYTVNQNFGGMIGFVIEKTQDSIQDDLINAIEDIYTNNPIGKLKTKIKGNSENSIFGNNNTFDSIHIRKNTITGEDEEFTIHHIIMDFVNA